MSKARTQAIAVTVVIVAAVLLGLLAVMAVQPVPAAQGQSSAGCYRMAGGDKWICQSGGEMEFQSGSTLDVQSGATFSVGGNASLNTFTTSGNSNVGGTLAVAGALSVQTDLNLVAQDAISVTAAAIITPTGAFQLLESAGNVSSGDISNSCTNGQVVTFLNTTNTAITIPDSGDNNLSAAAVLGQWDTLTVICYGVTDWYEVARSNN